MSEELKDIQNQKEAFKKKLDNKEITPTDYNNKIRELLAKERQINHEQSEEKDRKEMLADIKIIKICAIVIAVIMSISMIASIGAAIKISSFSNAVTEATGADSEIYYDDEEDDGTY